MKRFKGKYRSESHRLPRWNYSDEAIYFLTIVTKNRVCHLGKIDENHKMKLSGFGEIVRDQWVLSFKIRKELILHEYMIMPNHIHALIEIVKPENTKTRPVDAHGRAHLQDAQFRDLKPQPTFQPPRDIKRNMPRREPKSISSFMAGFKSAVNTKIDDFIDEQQLKTRKFNRKNQFFQNNYHDHVVRNKMEYQRIKYYIINNPKNWNNDNLLG